MAAKRTLGTIALGFALTSGHAFAQQTNVNAGQPGQAGQPGNANAGQAAGANRTAQAQGNANFADGEIPGPIDSLQDLQDTGKMVFKMADTDNNGAISQKEAIDLGNTVVGGIFFRADADGDGKITKQEADQVREEIFRQRPWLRVVLQKAGAQQRQDGQPNANQAIQGLSNLLDSNNDKALSATEVRQVVESSVQGLFSVADTDRDGQLSPSEVNGAMVGVAQAAGQALFQAADKDNNGQISREEFLDSMREPANTVFSVLDANGDGQLSQQEMQRAQRVIGSQIQALQVPEPANSPANMIRTGRTPQQAGQVPNIRIPDPSQGGANPNQPAPGGQPGAAQPGATAPQPGAPAPGQVR